jgi:hypothetical protein
MLANLKRENLTTICQKNSVIYEKVEFFIKETLYIFCLCYLVTYANILTHIFHIDASNISIL